MEIQRELLGSCDRRVTLLCDLMSFADIVVGGGRSLRRRFSVRVECVGRWKRGWVEGRHLENSEDGRIVDTETLTTGSGLLWDPFLVTN